MTFEVGHTLARATPPRAMARIAKGMRARLAALPLERVFMGSSLRRRCVRHRRLPCVTCARRGAVAVPSRSTRAQWSTRSLGRCALIRTVSACDKPGRRDCWSRPLGAGDRKPPDSRAYGRRERARLRPTQVHEARIAVVAGATLLFQDPGALEEVTRVAREWFVRYPHPTLPGGDRL